MRERASQRREPTQAERAAVQRRVAEFRATYEETIGTPPPDRAITQLGITVWKRLGFE